MPSAFITSRADVEILGKVMTKDDISEIESHMGIEGNYYAAAIEKKNFLLDLIKKSGVFAVNFSSIKNSAQTRADGKYLDKFSKLGIPKKEAEKINCPLVGGADSFECALDRIIDMGERAIIIGSIIKKHKV